MTRYADAPPPMTDRGDETPLSRAEAGELRDLVSTCPDGFVSFQEHDALEPNPAPSNHVMPSATYGFPASHLLPVLDDLASRGRKVGRTYHTDWYGFVRRPYAFTFRLEGNLVDEGYDGFPGDVARLLGAWKGGGAGEAVLGAWARQHKVDGQDYKRIFWALEKAVDAELGSEDFKGFMLHPGKPAAWRDAFLATGIAAFVDRRSFMTADIRQQVAVFDHAALRDVVRQDNPCCLAVPARRP